VGLDFRERLEAENGEEEGMGRTALQWYEGEWGRNDLKIGPVSAQLKYVRTYISAFDRTHAWRMWCKLGSVFEHTG
jgi:hypothetical protein